MLSTSLILFAFIVFTCVFLNKFSNKIGIPVLLLFLLLGIYSGGDYDAFAEENGWAVNAISTVALIFIMFYGGFGTRWKSAKPVVLEASLLATVGVALTAGLVGLFCHFALAWGWVESLLMGAVISSTDAASVFSILRTRKLGLKNNTAPMIEVESGSNDPMSYMLTSIMLSMLTTDVSAGNVLWELFSQMVFGAGCGWLISWSTLWMFRRIAFRNNGFDLLLFVSIALASYAIPDLIGGNGYLSVYIVGVALGNFGIQQNKILVPFFDSLTSLMQIIIFYLLGMMAIPTSLASSVGPAMLIFAFLTFVARPLAVTGVLAPFRKYPANQLTLLSFVGLRGAASIVFAIQILTDNTKLDNDIFSIVFCIVLISIALQGSLIPLVAKKTRMTDNSDVMTTFNDFSESSDVVFGSIPLQQGNRWIGKYFRDIQLPHGCIAAMVVRDGLHLVPDGNTQLQEGDEVVMCTRSYRENTADSVTKHQLPEVSRWNGRPVRDYSQGRNSLVVMILRGDERIIPKGSTLMQNNDILVLLERG